MGRSDLDPTEESLERKRVSNQSLYERGSRMHVKEAEGEPGGSSGGGR